MPRRMVDIEVKIHHETEKALLVSTDVSEKVWIPKVVNGEELEIDESRGGWAVITMPEYLATEKELV